MSYDQDAADWQRLYVQAKATIATLTAQLEAAEDALRLERLRNPLNATVAEDPFPIDLTGGDG